MVQNRNLIVFLTMSIQIICVLIAIIFQDFFFLNDFNMYLYGIVVVGVLFLHIIIYHTIAKKLYRNCCFRNEWGNIRNYICNVRKNNQTLEIIPPPPVIIIQSPTTIQIGTLLN